jgi:hypothetical protein
MFKIRNDREGWFVSSDQTDKGVQVRKQPLPLTIHFSDGVSVKTCPEDGGLSVDVSDLEQKAFMLLQSESAMDI